MYGASLTLTGTAALLAAAAAPLKIDAMLFGGNDMHVTESVLTRGGDHRKLSWRFPCQNWCSAV